MSFVALKRVFPNEFSSIEQGGSFEGESHTRDFKGLNGKLEEGRVLFSAFPQCVRNLPYGSEMFARMVSSKVEKVDPTRGTLRD